MAVMKHSVLLLTLVLGVAGTASPIPRVLQLLSGMEEDEKSKEHVDALRTAKDALTENSHAAGEQTYSFQQLKLVSSVRYPGKNVMQLLKDAASRTDSTAIRLLVWPVSNIIRASQPAEGANVFASINSLISTMILSKEKSLLEDSSHAEQFKKDMNAATEKVAAKTSEFRKYKAKVDKLVSKSAGLKAEVSDLKQAISILAEDESTATAIRQKELAIFSKNEQELDSGLKGVKTALKALRDAYGEQGAGAASGIIGLLEVVYFDFEKHLAEIRVAELTAAEDFEKDKKAMKLEKKRMQRYCQRLDADVIEVEGDLDGVRSGLDGAKQYAETVKAKCTVTPESYEKKKADIDDLKAVLAALDLKNALRR